MPELRHSLMRPINISLLDRAEALRHSFTGGGRALFWFFAILIIFSSGALAAMANQAFMVSVPARGGSLTEGEVGSPRFINPVLAISDADNDLTALVYSGLLKSRPDGTFAPDLASSYSISPDGRTYTVHLRANIVFQDGTPVTADDVVFTAQKALDPAIKSPLRANWDGVTVAKQDDRTVQFTLSAPYAPFIGNLTMGILPKHLWENVSAEEFPFSNLNTMPVGSGPYRVADVTHNSSGVPVAYDLSSFDRYALGEPYITRFTLRFYQSEEALVAALESGEVEAGSGISPAELSKLGGFDVLTAPENRVFGVFFNQSQNPVLLDGAVRKALSDATDRTGLVSAVLGGYGTPTAGPIPPGADGNPAAAARDGSAAAARQELLDAGWTPNQNGVLEKKSGSGKSAQTQTLSFTLSTGNVPELTAAADHLKSQWARMGADVNVQVFNQGDLSQNVIRPRKYDALLFGEVVGQALDLFAFWHSSQRNDPGLNIALYANSTADKILSDLRQTDDPGKRQELYAQFAQEVVKDNPAVFLYSPDFVYVVPSAVKGVTLGSIESPSDRFSTVERWYRDTDHVWKLFER